MRGNMNSLNIPAHSDVRCSFRMRQEKHVTQVHVDKNILWYMVWKMALKNVKFQLQYSWFLQLKHTLSRQLRKESSRSPIWQSNQNKLPTAVEHLQRQTILLAREGTQLPSNRECCAANGPGVLGQHLCKPCHYEKFFCLLIISLIFMQFNIVLKPQLELDTIYWLSN